MKKGILITLFVIITSDILAQSDNHHQMTSTNQTGARYEIIQSAVGTWATFKLDKYTGNIYHLDRNSSSDEIWWKIDVQDLDKEDIYNNQINFQLILSGIDIRECFLLNIHNGNTWKYFYDHGKYLFIKINNKVLKGDDTHKTSDKL